MENNRILENVDGPWWSQLGPTERSVGLGNISWG